MRPSVREEGREQWGILVAISFHDGVQDMVQLNPLVCSGGARKKIAWCITSISKLKRKICMLV
jgi:hypothetical protein